MHKFYIAALCLFLLIFQNSPVKAKAFKFQTKSEKSGDILFKANNLRHERELGLVIATGSVELIKGERVLRADTVSYNQRQDLVTATGNVVLMEPDGSVSFVDYAELTGDFKNGVVENIRILMLDGARLAATGGRRIEGNKLELRKAVYSPCRSCPKENTTPLWQIKAIDVFHNKLDKNIEYRDAFMEFMGIPVFYTPYFTHPDPTVKRRTGLLIPKYSSNNILGVRFETPYYINIAAHKDATIRPIYTTKEGLVLAGEYRQRFIDGEIRLRGSGTNGTKISGGKGFRGHFFGDFKHDLNKTWRSGGEVRLTSDDTYLQRYGFRDSDTLKSHAFLEGFRGQNYASIQSFFWRGLRNTDDPAQIPLILPMFEANFHTPIGQGNTFWKLDANLLSLERSEGVNSKRISLKNSIELPHITPLGDVYHIYGSLQTDVYHNSNYKNSSTFSGRVFPMVGVDWRLPVSRGTRFGTQLIEPVIGLQIAPNGGNSEKIPNEDSQDIEFDETNLFSRNRFTGLDRVEGGQRVYYGLKLGNIGFDTYSTGFIGQSYRISRNSDFAENSGLKENFSDIVGGLSIRPTKNIAIEYRFRLDKDNYSARRNEFSAKAGSSLLRFNLNYNFFDEGSGSGEFTDREEITYGFSSQFSKAWSINASSTRDLQLSNTLNQKFGLNFYCDCFTMNLNFERTFTEDRDVKPSDTVFLKLIFKNLGTLYTEGGDN